MTLWSNLFGNLFGDSAAECEARGDQFAAVNSWRRAHEEFSQALQKTSRDVPAHERIAAKLEEAGTRSFESLIEDIHSRIDVREFTYANEQLAQARRLAETSSQMLRVEECESRLRGAGRYEARQSAAQPIRNESEKNNTPSPDRESIAKPAAHVVRTPKPAGTDAAAANPDQALRRLLAHLPAAEVERRLALGPRYQDAALALAAGEAERAAVLLEKLHVEQPKEGLVVYDLGAALVALGRLREAQELYAQRVEEHPDDWQAYYELAQVLWACDVKDKALQVVEIGVQRFPRCGHLMTQWGIFLQRLGSSAMAMDRFSQALDLDAFDDAGLYHSIANLHAEQGELDKARQAYLKALELAPQNVGTLLDYAEFLLEKARDAAACKAILDTVFRILRTSGDRPSYKVYASYLSSRAHLLLGERERALLAVTRAIEDNPHVWLRSKLESQRQAVLTV